MNFVTDILPRIFEVCVFPLLGVLTAYLINFISAKNKELKKKLNNELFNSTLDQLNNLITRCVISTNQTYVETLKKQGKFDRNAQEEAFLATYNNVLQILSEESKTILETGLSNLTLYITQQIEAQVSEYKMPSTKEE